MKHMKISITFIVSVLSLYLFAVNVIAAEPNVEEIVVNPPNPAPLSTITFTATISHSDQLDDIRLIVEECKEGFCYSDGFNEPMSLTDEGKYDAEITLKHDDSTKIQYNLNIKSGDSWYNASKEELYLGTSNTDNDDGLNGTPGFEVILFLAAISIGLLFKRKRLG
ncbi:MAG: hypothetical protein JSW62_01155 [Thermoplasmatales archaeon]|nr:MAG: hypothetical protein JSW62_01155 [Thermoplasmatales archaeon]